jgi:hypothetical protein
MAQYSLKYFAFEGHRSLKKILIESRKNEKKNRKQIPTIPSQFYYTSLIFHPYYPSYSRGSFVAGIWGIGLGRLKNLELKYIIPGALPSIS